MRAEASMVRRMCGVSMKKRLSNEELRGRLGIDCVSEAVRRGRLRWFGHVEQKGDEWVRKCMEDLKMEGNAGRGRPRKTWLESVKDDMKRIGLRREMPQDRSEWRSAVRGKCLNCV